MPGEYLPPVVISVIGDDSAFLRMITKDQALLQQFGKSEANVLIGADDKPLVAGVAQARAAVDQLTKVQQNVLIGADTAPFLASLAKAKAEAAAISTDWARLSGINAGLAAWGGSTAGGGGGGGRGGILGFLGGLLAGGGGGGGGGGILSALGFGAGGSKGVFGIGAGMASFGSIGSLLGLGAEHLITTLLGVGGSAVGAGVGGGLLGLGALGTGAVGMGTDATGLGQALNDTKLLVQAQNQATQAQAQYNYMVQTYGANSAQAAASLQTFQQAQANVNATLSGFPAVAQSAIAATANTAQAFHQMFNAATGPAEKIGAQILQQAMQVGMAFLPTIGKYAAENMGIIKKDIQPLFSWLTSMQGGTGKGFLGKLLGGGQVGGLAIFTNLEQVFQKNLPTAIKALSQGFEFFAKTVDVAAQYTGQFMSKLAAFFTHMNSPAAFGKWASEVGKLIGLFRTWLHFMLAVGKTIYDIFKPAVGAGQAVIRVLTGALNILDKWLTTASNSKALHNLFSAHLTQLVKGFGAALTAAIPLVLDLAKGFLPVLTVGAQLGALVFTPITAALRALAKVPFAATVLGWVGTFLLLQRAVGGLRLTNLTTLFSGLAGGIGSALNWLKLLPTTIGVAALKLQQFGSALLTAGARAATWAAQTVASAARFAAQYAVAIARAIAAGVVWAAEHAALAAAFIAENVAMAASATAAFVAENIATLGIAAAIALLIAGVVYAATHWKQVWGAMKDAATAVWDALKTAASALGSALSATWGAMESAARTVWGGMESAISSTMHAIEAVVSAVWGAIQAIWSAISPAVHADIISPIQAVLGVWQSVWGGITSAVQSAWGVISGILHDISSAISAVMGGINDLGAGISKVSSAGGLLNKIPGYSTLHKYVPFLAAGGIVTSPTLAMVGESGPEMVIPLSRVNPSAVAPLPASGGGYGAGGVTLHTDIRIFAPTGNAGDISAALEKALGQRDQQLIAKLRAGTPYS